MSLDLTQEQLQVADIYQITLNTGKVLYLTNYGGTYTHLPGIDGNIYKLTSITRSKIGWHTDLQIDTVDLSFGIHAFEIDGKTITEAIAFGWFDNAEVIISQVNPKLVTQKREIFRGQVAKGIKFNRKTVKLYATSVLDLLKATVPKLIYGEQCPHRLYDNYCQITKSTWERAGSAASGSTKTRIYASVFNYASNPEGYFVLGELKMTSGANNDVRRTVRSHSNGYVEVYIPFDFDIAVGDTFLAYAGCDKSGTTCHDKFSNYVNFLGFEYTPRPEVMY
ncbi:MAG: phage BR0599 family protein [Candidatus Omnitrophica bacterium]|nr:phage BR0599 family protein [Candidatus Omnitrophota bacterium]